MALDARNGTRLWHQQLVHHDLWDFDLPQAPKLLTMRQNGRNVDVVAQATKMGFVFVFERKTGRPIFPIEERPVPQTDVPGEVSWPTQPFPTKPAPFARQTFTEKDINPFLPPAELEAMRQKVRNSRNEGLYTPPSLRGSISMPGHNGGANWGSGAVDPIRGEMYIVSKNMPVMLRLVRSNEEPTAGGALGGGPPSPIITPAEEAKLIAEAKEALAKGPVRYTSPYDFMLSPTNAMTAIGPPWSQLTAYDLNTGEIKWQVPDGGVTPPPGANVNIPADSGSHMPRGGPLVTAGGLVFVATASDRTVRAYDRDNGKVVWKTDLPTGSEGVPASYEVNGRQFVVFPVAAGTGGFSIRWGGPGPAAGAAPAVGRSRRQRRGGARTRAWRARGRTAAAAGVLHRLRVAAEVVTDESRRDPQSRCRRRRSVVVTGCVAARRVGGQPAAGADARPVTSRRLAALQPRSRGHPLFAARRRSRPRTSRASRRHGPTPLQSSGGGPLGGGSSAVPLVVRGDHGRAERQPRRRRRRRDGKEVWQFEVPAPPGAAARGGRGGAAAGRPSSAVSATGPARRATRPASSSWPATG